MRGLVCRGSVSSSAPSLYLWAGQPQALPVSATPACCMISSRVLSPTCFDDNFKDNGTLLECMVTVSLMQHLHEIVKTSNHVWLGWLYWGIMVRHDSDLRLQNTEKQLTSNLRVDAKTPNGIGHWHHTSSVCLLDHNLQYLHLKYVVENEEFYLFIFSNAHGIPEGVWNAGSNFTPSSTAFFRNIWKVKQLSKPLW